MEHRPERRVLNQRQLLLSALVFVMIAISVLILSRFIPVRADAQQHTSVSFGRRRPILTGDHRYIVEVAPFESTVAISGIIVPGDFKPVAAPFDGSIKEIRFNYGEFVTRGQNLFIMDTSEVAHQLRTAKIAYIKASEAARNVINWSNGPEVARAKRALESREASLLTIQARLGETRKLFERGLVARTELDDLLQQSQNQARELDSAREELETTLSRGSPDERDLAELQLSDAEFQLADKQKRSANMIVRADVSGVLTRPSTGDGSEKSSDLYPGAHVSQGEVVGEIAYQDKLAVIFNLNEEDANRVAEGQLATVTGAGFPNITATGHVAVVSAAASGSTNGPTSFEGKISLDNLTPDEANAIRLGMSANITIYLRKIDNAISVPPEAIIGGGPNAAVDVEDQRSGQIRQTAVRVGMVIADRVQILSGLKAGDVVVWGDPAAASSALGRSKPSHAVTGTAVSTSASATAVGTR